MHSNHIFSFVLKVRKKTNIQLNIYLHNNNLGVYSIIASITIWLYNDLKLSNYFHGTFLKLKNR